MSHTILLLTLVILVIAALPRWPHSASWGYFPSGTIGVIAVILLALIVTGRF